MSKTIIAKVREDVEEAGRQLETAKDLIARLRRAGEDVSEMEREQRRIELRIARYKKAFAS